VNDSGEKRALAEIECQYRSETPSPIPKAEPHSYSLRCVVETVAYQKSSVIRALISAVEIGNSESVTEFRALLPDLVGLWGTESGK
jgi:hypothetical protein